MENIKSLTAGIKPVEGIIFIPGKENKLKNHPLCK
jgi:hypothetical protein